MLSNYNMTGQSVIFPPQVHVRRRGILYVRPRHDFTQRHNELRDLDPELLSAVCNNVEWAKNAQLQITQSSRENGSFNEERAICKVGQKHLYP